MSTGFVVKFDDNLWVLTSAHVLGMVFSSRPCRPISVTLANQLFQPRVRCIHERGMVNAIVRGVNCRHDLLLLKVLEADLGNYCPGPHPPLRLAETAPDVFKTLVMISWPSRPSGTAVRGHVSNPSRRFADLEIDNPWGFTMNMAEVDIRSAAGSSGGPMLNDRAQVAGVLHGGDTVFSFFVRLVDLRQAMAQWDVL